MKKSQNLTKLFSIAAVSVGMISAASAVTESFTTTTPITLTLTDWSKTLAFPQFNPALGTLQSVTFSLSASISTVITVSNSALASSTAVGNAKTEVQFSLGDPLLTINTAPSFNGSLSSNPFIDDTSSAFGFNLAPGDSATSGTIVRSVNNQTGDSPYTDPGILAEFTGTGSEQVTVNTLTQTSLTGSGTGNTSADQVTQGSATGSVTYDYIPAPAPEPSTMALLGLGSLAAVAFRRRKA